MMELALTAIDLLRAKIFPLLITVKLLTDVTLCARDLSTPVVEMYSPVASSSATDRRHTKLVFSTAAFRTTFTAESWNSTPQIVSQEKIPSQLTMLAFATGHQPLAAKKNVQLGRFTKDARAFASSSERVTMLSTEFLTPIDVEMSKRLLQLADALTDRSGITRNALMKASVHVIAISHRRLNAKLGVILTTRHSTAVITISRALASTLLLSRPETRISETRPLSKSMSIRDFVATLFPAFEAGLSSSLAKTKDQMRLLVTSSLLKALRWFSKIVLKATATIIDGMAIPMF